MILRCVYRAIKRKLKWWGVELRNSFIPNHDICSTRETLKYIEKHHCSVSRYGDGELGQCYEDYEIGFQRPSKELAEALLRVLHSDGAACNHITCIPYSCNSQKKMTPKAAFFWRNWVHNHKKNILSRLPYKRYYDSLVSRLYMDYDDKSNAKALFESWKRIWYKQNLVIVEGYYSRLGIGNDLFSGAANIERILVPAENAFSSYSKILNAVKEYCTKDQLILLAIGPTATVLAYDLAVAGFWAIDVGHIDVEYCWYKAGAFQKEPIAGKYVNEAEENALIVNDFYSDYRDSVIIRIE